MAELKRRKDELERSLAKLGRDKQDWETVPSDYLQYVRQQTVDGKDLDGKALQKAGKMLLKNFHPDKNRGNEEVAEAAFKVYNVAYQQYCDGYSNHVFTRQEKKHLRNFKGAFPSQAKYDEVRAQLKNTNDIVQNKFNSFFARW